MAVAVGLEIRMTERKEQVWHVVLQVNHSYKLWFNK